MILDSKKQQQLLLDLLGEVPVSTDLKSLFGGPPEEIKKLFEAIREARFANPVEDK